MGHILKLEHTGDSDSYQGWTNKIEVMGTCLSKSERKEPQGSLDDAGSLMKQHSIKNTQTNLPDVLNANAGFEDNEAGTGPADGWLEDGNPLAVRTGTSHEGSYAMLFEPNSNSERLYQRVNLTGFAGRDIDIAGWQRLAFPASTTGDLIFAVHRKVVAYGDPPPPNCSGTWPSGRNENEKYQSTYVKVIDWRISPTIDWGPHTSGPNGKAWTVSSSDAVDIRLRIRSNVKDANGDFVAILFDNTTVRDCGSVCNFSSAP